MPYPMKQKKKGVKMGNLTETSYFEELKEAQESYFGNEITSQDVEKYFDLESDCTTKKEFCEIIARFINDPSKMAYIYRNEISLHNESESDK